MQGENLQIRFEKLKARPVLFSLFLALTLYIALVFATLIWLAIHTEDTIQRRIAQSPSVTVIIQKPATEENISDPAGEESTHSNDDAVIDTPPAEAPPASWNNKDTTAPDDANPTSDAQDQTSENKVPETTGTAEPVATTPLENKKLHWQSLARDFNHDDPRPRIGLIVVDLGVTQNISNQAITQLPADVALAFQTVSPDAAKWLEQSHKAGHENLISIPMEPNRYPQNDPGPHTLLTMLSAKDNAERLTQSLHYKTYALGVIPSQGEKFITDNKALTPVLNTLKDQELAFIDGTQNPKSVADSLARLARLPFLNVTHVIDATKSGKELENTFSALEQQAKDNGKAIALILPYPIAIEQTKKWIGTFQEKNLLLTPISALLLDTKDNVSSVDSATTPIKK